MDTRWCVRHTDLIVRLGKLRDAAREHIKGKATPTSSPRDCSPRPAPRSCGAVGPMTRPTGQHSPPGPGTSSTIWSAGGCGTPTRSPATRRSAWRTAPAGCWHGEPLVTCTPPGVSGSGCVLQDSGAVRVAFCGADVRSPVEHQLFGLRTRIHLSGSSLRTRGVHATGPRRIGDIGANSQAVSARARHETRQWS